MGVSSSLLAAAAELRPQMEAAKREYERLQKLIGDLEAEHRRAVAREERSPATQPQSARRKKGSASASGQRTNGAADSGARLTFADLVLEAVRAQTKPFSILEVRAYLEQRYPERLAQIKGPRISTQLWNLRRERVIEYQTKAEKGGSHTYILL